MCPNNILIIFVLISLKVWESLRKSRCFCVTPRTYEYDYHRIATCENENEKKTPNSRVLFIKLTRPGACAVRNGESGSSVRIVRAFGNVLKCRISTNTRRRTVFQGKSFFKRFKNKANTCRLKRV